MTEKFLEVRRHVSCCNFTHVLRRTPRASALEETDKVQEYRLLVEMEVWARHHAATCWALKVPEGGIG